LEIKAIDLQYSYQWEHFNTVEDDMSHAKRSDYGTLTGDVQNWAAIIQNYIIQVNKRKHIKITMIFNNLFERFKVGK
jgi:hypothetical protein